MKVKTQSEYSKKLLDPRWQKKRLEILSRDNFTCCGCQDTTKTLHVHHIEYLPGREPWEYGDELLETLCADCHEVQTRLDQDLKQAEVSLLKQVRLMGVADRLSLGDMGWVHFEALVIIARDRSKLEELFRLAFSTTNEVAKTGL